MFSLTYFFTDFHVHFYYLWCQKTYVFGLDNYKYVFGKGNRYERKAGKFERKDFSIFEFAQGKLYSKDYKGLFIWCLGILISKIMETSVMELDQENPANKRPSIQAEPVKFPTLNIYNTPRVLRQRINGSRPPLQRYREPVIASNRDKNYETDQIQSYFLKRFAEKDGLIFEYKKMKSDMEAYMQDSVKFFKDQGRGLYPTEFRK